MKQKTYKLKQPVEWAGQTYTQLTLRKIKVKHMLEIDLMTAGQNPIAQQATLMAASAGVDVGVIHEMDMDDFSAAQEVVESFFAAADTDNTHSP